MGFTALTSKSTNALYTLFTANNDQFEKVKTLTFWKKWVYVLFHYINMAT